MSDFDRNPFATPHASALAGFAREEPPAPPHAELLALARWIAAYAHRARGFKARDCEVDTFVLEALLIEAGAFDRDPALLQETLERGRGLGGLARKLYEATCKRAGGTPEVIPEPTSAAEPASGRSGSEGASARAVGAPEPATETEALQSALLTGLRGLAMVGLWLHQFGREFEPLYGFVHEALDATASPVSSAERALSLLCRCATVNLRALEVLDGAHAASCGFWRRASRAPGAKEKRPG